MVDEVRQLPAGVDRLAGDGVGPGDGPGAAAEHANLADVAVLPLDEPEEGGHVRPPEVIAGLETGEETSLGEALEVVLTNVLKIMKSGKYPIISTATHQHCCP